MQMEIVCLFCDESPINRHISAFLNLFNKLILCKFLLLLTASDNVHWICKHVFPWLNQFFLIITEIIESEAFPSSKDTVHMLSHGLCQFLILSEANIAFVSTSNKKIGLRQKVETRENYLSVSTQLFDITPPSMSFCFTVFCRFSSRRVRE